MSKNVIEVRNLGKKYYLGESHLFRDSEEQAFWALKNVNFEIKEGDAVGIIGHNGAGKSTLLKVLSRIIKPTTGSARIIGKVRTILEIGTGFVPELTGRENILLNGALLGMTSKEIKDKFDDIVSFSELEKFLDTPVKRYSSGMYVRLAFAVAANLNPDILIVDEVLAVGDINFQKKCLEKLESESQYKGRTIIFVSHNLTAVRSFCKRALFLEQGQLVMDGEVNQVVEKFLSKANQAIQVKDKNLKDRLNRTTGKVRFTNVVVKNSCAEPTWQFKSNESVSIEFNYEVIEEVSELAVLFFIKSVEGKIITTFKLILSRASLRSGFRGEGKLHIPNLPLRPGEFGLYICFSNLDGSFNHDVIDENILPYLIVDSNEQDPELRKGLFSVAHHVDNLG